MAKSLGEEAAELRRLRSLDQEALARMVEEGDRVSAALAGAREEAGDLGPVLDLDLRGAGSRVLVREAEAKRAGPEAGREGEGQCRQGTRAGEIEEENKSRLVDANKKSPRAWESRRRRGW